jgi:hypothetical protein
MNMKIGIIAIISLVAAVALCGVLPAVTAFNDGGNSQRPNPPEEETFGNCLSLPVIWSDGVTKDLRGDPDSAIFEDDWWYHWGYEEDGTPLSCAPDPDNSTLCDDEMSGEETGPLPGPNSKIVYLQQQENNSWQAESLNAAAEGSEVHVDMINWGDNLEAVSWNEYSVLRTEVVLFQNLSEDGDFDQMKGFKMEHLFDQGIDEMWGTNTTEYLSDIATVYSGCARWTIQKLDDSEYIKKTADIEGNLSLDWNATTGEWEGNVSETYFNGAVWESEDVDGPGYYSAEINIGGKVIYGYNWFVRDIDDAPGFYRLTFSLDSENCLDSENSPVTLNTFFTEDITEIVEFGVVEGDTDTNDPSGDENDPNGDQGQDEPNANGGDNEPNDGEDSKNPGNLIPGGIARINFTNNLTYMDIQILEK